LKRVLFLLIILSLIINITLGEEFFIQGIVFKGIKYTPYSQIQELLKIKPFQTLSLEVIENEMERIRKLSIFQEISYRLNKIDGGYELVIEVKEFPIISEVKFPKIKIFKEEEIKKNIYSASGKFFIETKIKEDLEKIKKLYESNGFILSKDPEYIFKDNILTFYWEELPTIKNIIFETKNEKEREIIKKELDLRLGEYFNTKEIELANQRLLRENIPFTINYRFELEEDGIILYLSLKPLFLNSINLSIYSLNNLDLRYVFYNLNLGTISFDLSFSKNSYPFYSIFWNYDRFSLNLDNTYGIFLYKDEFKRDFTIKIGLKIPIFSIGNKAILFSFERNTLVKHNNFLYLNGNLQKFDIEFVGGGSIENYTSLNFLSDNYWSYGKGLDERIIEAKGELRYIIGDSTENNNINFLFSYGFPAMNQNYIFLFTGGESNFKTGEIKSFQDIAFNFYGGLNWIWLHEKWIFELSFVFRGPEKLEWKMKSILNF